MFRVGNGYDVHRLDIGTELIIGGVHIPYEKGLVGHSDADVLTHAIMDSLLGALAHGDIGNIFPDSDEYKDANSITLLKKILEIVKRKKYSVGNIDAVIIAQRPKLAPYIAEMRGIIAEALSIATTQVSIKATTEEGLGFTGSGEGIAAHAVCLLFKKE